MEPGRDSSDCCPLSTSSQSYSCHEHRARHAAPLRPDGFMRFIIPATNHSRLRVPLSQSPVTEHIEDGHSIILSLISRYRLTSSAESFSAGESTTSTPRCVSAAIARCRSSSI